MKPYFEADGVQLYLGDMREVLPALSLEADVVIADPPYGETSLAWDRWPDGWPAHIHGITRQPWCFGSMRMLLEQRDEFAGWRLAQDLIWEKRNGTGFAADRFKRVHEIVTHWYHGRWDDLYRNPQREPSDRPHRVKDSIDRRAANGTPHAGSIGPGRGVYDGMRLVRSVLRAPSVRGKALHPTEKPASILRPLVAYSSPIGGLVVDPFAGSGSTLAVAREMGRRAVGIEADERYAEVIAERLSQVDLFASVEAGGAA